MITAELYLHCMPCYQQSSYQNYMQNKIFTLLPVCQNLMFWLLFVLNKHCNFKCWSPFMTILTGKLKYLKENLSNLDWPELKAQVPYQASLFGIPGRQSSTGHVVLHVHQFCLVSTIPPMRHIYSYLCCIT